MTPVFQICKSGAQTEKRTKLEAHSFHACFVTTVSDRANLPAHQNGSTTQRL